jgi:hypothetical protein
MEGQGKDQGKCHVEEEAKDMKSCRRSDRDTKSLAEKSNGVKPVLGKEGTGQVEGKGDKES